MTLRVLACLALGLLFAAPSTAVQTLAPGQTHNTYGAFDPEAPTITVEDIEAHQIQRQQALDEYAKESERRRVESERRARLCSAQAPAPAAASPMPAAPAAAAAGNGELRAMSTQDLLVRFQRTQDPAALEELRRRSQPGAATPAPSAAPPANALEQLARLPGMNARFGDQLRLASRAGDPRVQACLEEAERVVTEQPPEPAVDFLNLEPEATRPLRDGRTSSILHDIPPLAADGSDGYRRYNVVARGGPYGARAVPMKEAMARPGRRDPWRMPSVEEETRSARIAGTPGPQQQERPRPSANGLGGALQQLGEKLKGSPR